ncbi:short-chain fatty acyl-CoA regulator family protein [Pseudovibrio sp. SPO723]|uniref:short-chain fatty acyl-CoA regulator family protein n=1 Tax=Nesiotobacter zosterae TaxID=392721 RepID=UPI0029C10F71|nr:short-chain fatty acyl-CoA regulator family protein [Pseudovibrio sp. SPO723]MDX5592866.1 short-chain fatty acyl-CoA regulator family protein [Pseudovibrio sp. SPO723]
MKKAFLGGRLRQLREQNKLTQAALAQRLDISASYLNQLERNQRPLTVQVLLKINQEFGLDIQFFSEEGDARLLAELREVFHTEMQEDAVTAAQLRDLVDNTPAVARRFVRLYRDYREADELAKTQVLGGTPANSAANARTAFEDVRDFFYDKRNYFEQLDNKAEAIFENASLSIGHSLDGLTRRLRNRHDIEVALVDMPEGGQIRHYNAQEHVLQLARSLRGGQRAFQIALQIGLLEAQSEIERQVSTVEFATNETRELARIGLAKYFAAALIMPYNAFWKAAEKSRYDIAWLSRQFGAGFETTCHRLSTLQRPTQKGIPFFFLRVDRAGNISKRQSATDFHFSKVGGSCPLWKVHAAFDQPGEILTQIAQMPDGRTYFWVTRTVASGYGSYGAPGKFFSIALGCDIQHASRMVYSKGLDLSDPEAATPIGAGCKMCPREKCTQRAFPMVGKSIEIDANSAGFAPYSSD